MLGGTVCPRARTCALALAIGAALVLGMPPAHASDVTIEFVSAPRGDGELDGVVSITVRAVANLSTLQSFSVWAESDRAAPFRRQVDHGPWGLLDAVREDVISMTWDTGALPRDGGTYRIVASAKSHLDGDVPAVALITGLRVAAAAAEPGRLVDAPAPAPRQQAAAPRSTLSIGRTIADAAPPPPDGPEPVPAGDAPAGVGLAAASPDPEGARGPFERAAALVTMMAALQLLVAASRRRPAVAAPAPEPAADAAPRKGRRRRPPKVDYRLPARRTF